MILTQITTRVHTKILSPWHTHQSFNIWLIVQIWYPWIGSLTPFCMLIIDAMHSPIYQTNIGIILILGKSIRSVWNLLQHLQWPIQVKTIWYFTSIAGPRCQNNASAVQVYIWFIITVLYYVERDVKHWVTPIAHDHLRQLGPLIFDIIILMYWLALSHSELVEACFECSQLPW